MSETSLRVPAMYADHHVLRVREALLGLPGVQQVVASAARRQVTIAHEDGASPEAWVEALTAAGYPPEQEVPLGAMPRSHEDGSTWHTLIQRTTTTERKDLEMSGDFRRY